MNKTFAFFVLIISFSCGTKTKQAEDTIATIKNEVRPIDEGLFNIELQIDKLGEEQYSFSTCLELYSGTYVISPFQKMKHIVLF